MGETVLARLCELILTRLDDGARTLRSEGIDESTRAARLGIHGSAAKVIRLHAIEEELGIRVQDLLRAVEEEFEISLPRSRVHGTSDLGELSTLIERELA
jgi:hypothetical protein